MIMMTDPGDEPVDASNDAGSLGDTSDVYRAHCTSCNLEVELNELDPVLDLADTHQTLYGSLHVGEFEQIDGRSASDDD